MEFRAHFEFVFILWKLSVMEHITSGISFKWCDILGDYAKELCEILVFAASYRKSKR
jgi:hypothetical protein